MGLLVEPLSPEVIKRWRKGIFRLTPTEIVVAKDLVRGLTFQEMADARGVSKRTAEFQARQIYAKCDCTRAQFVQAAIEFQHDPTVNEYLEGMVHAETRSHVLIGRARRFMGPMEPDRTRRERR